MMFFNEFVFLLITTYLLTFIFLSIVDLHYCVSFRMYIYFLILHYSLLIYKILNIVPCCFCCCCLVTRLCPTLCNPVNCSPLDSSVHGISQTRILERVAIFFSRGSSRTSGQTHVSCLAGRFFTTEPPGKPRLYRKSLLFIYFIYGSIHLLIPHSQLILPPFPFGNYKFEISMSVSLFLYCK